jgi:transcriptional regulator with XRE-family HTH domain
MKNEIPGFAKRLTEKMAEHNLSQADLRRLTGLTTSMISHYCAGQRVPAIPAAIKIAKALNTTVEYLATGENTSNRYTSARQEPTLLVSENEAPYTH